MGPRSPGEHDWTAGKRRCVLEHGTKWRAEAPVALVPERIVDPELRRCADEVRGDVRFSGTGRRLVRRDEAERLAATYVCGDGLREVA